MYNKNQKDNFEKIKMQLDLLKQRLNNIDITLNIQEEILGAVTQNTKILFEEALVPVSGESVEEIMKKALPKGKLPKILFKK